MTNSALENNFLSVFLEWSVLKHLQRISHKQYSSSFCSSVFLSILSPILSFSNIFSFHVSSALSSFSFLYLLFSLSIFLCFKLLVFADYDPYAVAGVCNDHGKTYALYAITVRRRTPNGEEVWKTYRRYSDFHDFHMRITEQVMIKVKRGAWLGGSFVNLI